VVFVSLRVGVVGSRTAKIGAWPRRNPGARLVCLLNVTQKNYSAGLVLVYYWLDVQRGDRSAAGRDHGSRVYRDVFVALGIGRFLKRRAGVQLGLFFRLFCLILASTPRLPFTEFMHHGAIMLGRQQFC